MVQSRPRHQHWYRRVLLALCALVIVVAGIPPQAAAAVAEGDGWLVYGVNTTNSSPSKHYQSGSWSSAADLSTDTQSVRFTRIVGSPTESEMMQVHSNSNGSYRVHRWNGSAWSLEWTDTGGGTNTAAFVPRFDLAYDNLGNAVVFYSDNSTGTGEIRYRIFTNSTNTWSAEQTYNALRTTATVRMVRIENVPGTDQFLVAWNDTNMDLSANYYDLSANSFSGEPAAALSTDLALGVQGLNDPRTRNFDIAIESSSKEQLVCFSNFIVNDLTCATRGAGTGGSWGSVTAHTAFTTEPYDMQMAADPNTSSNEIAFCGLDGTLEVARWSGSAWSPTTVDSTLNTLDDVGTNCSVAWVRSGSTSQAVVTYDDSAAAGIDWVVYNPANTSWTVQTDHTGAFNTSGTNDKFHDLVRNPLDLDELVLVAVDNNNDLSVKKLAFNGSTYTWSSGDNGASSHNTNQNNHGGWTASFAFYGFAVTPTLSVDIVDAGGSSVASPSVTMGAVTSGNTCQTPTGTLGTSSQKIRVTNTTATPAWTLTVAATGGATANWSATTYTYDYNDSTSSGCGDGGDSDSLAGQLTVNASGGTRTAQAGCTTTGVTLGSSSAFVEGTTNSITILSASGSADTNCYWDLTDVALSQKIPSYQEPGSYALQLTLTVTAN